MAHNIEGVPQRMRHLPVDHRGYTVPWFVHFDEHGVPDFRIVGAGKIVHAWKHKLCWLCGEKMGRYQSFVIRPMCAINRTSAEPPAHRECAQYAALTCPFLTKPRMRRNEKDHEETTGLPLGTVAPAGSMIRRNPGCCAVWTTTKPSVFTVPGGFLFNIGDPHEVEWYAEGRDATRGEVLESIRTGLPLLVSEIAKEQPSRRDAARADLIRRAAAAGETLPHADPAFFEKLASLEGLARAAVE